MDDTYPLDFSALQQLLTILIFAAVPIALVVLMTIEIGTGISFGRRHRSELERVFDKRLRSARRAARRRSGTCPLLDPRTGNLIWLCRPEISASRMVLVASIAPDWSIRLLVYDFSELRARYFIRPVLGLPTEEALAKLASGSGLTTKHARPLRPSQHEQVVALLKRSEIMSTWT